MLCRNFKKWTLSIGFILASLSSFAGQPYVGEIRWFAGNFAPVGWHFCDGALLPINENDALFNLIGTVYGGDGEQTFALPDLRGRAPLHASASHPIAQASGSESVSLTVPQMPNHNHSLRATSEAATSVSPSNTSILGAQQMCIAAAPNATLNTNSIQNTGSSQPQDNMTPYITLNCIISLLGVFPSP